MSTETHLPESLYVLKAMLKHFAPMPPEAARRASKKLLAEVHAAMEDLRFRRTARASLSTDDERDAELYSKLNSLFAAPLRAGVSVEATADLWTVLWTVVRALNDICWVIDYYDRQKKLADVLHGKQNDYTLPGPLSRLLDLWESSDLRGQRPQGSTHGEPVRLL